MPRKTIKKVAKKVGRVATAPARWLGTQYLKEIKQRKEKDAREEWAAQVRANNAVGGYAGSVRRSLKKK